MKDLVEEHARQASSQEVQGDGADDLVCLETKAGESMQKGDKHPGACACRQSDPGRAADMTPPDRAEGPGQHHPFQSEIDHPSEFRAQPSQRSQQQRC